MTGAAIGFSLGVTLTLGGLGLFLFYFPEPATFDSDE